jgi:hypothetical protein
MDYSKMKIVYVITKRNDKSFWNRVGVAFINGDGSINVKLEALPVSGELQIRDYTPREEGASLPHRRTGNGHGDSETFSELT